MAAIKKIDLRRRKLLGKLIVTFLVASECVVAAPLDYSPSAPDNPLKGLVPYASASGKAQFPHSMEFSYFSLKDVMKGPNEFDWQVIEKTLNETKKRGNQLIFRIYCEYPGKESAVPQFLVDAGVKITKWSDGGEINYTPDYENPLLQEALTKFIVAMGNKYDGDPRVAFITAGLLGLWGEWHTYPRTDLWASKQLQRKVMESYAKAFSKTKVLLRYPTNSKSPNYAENDQRPFGYHDDSFGWATLDTGNKNDAWYFEPSLKACGAMDKWKKYPIGGEIRPELWKQSFTAERHPRDQGFVNCVERLHASWLLDSGLFDARIPVDQQRRESALKETARMGYEFYISNVKWEEGMIFLTVKNKGVAPFYYDWPVELEVNGQVIKTGWKLSGLLPGKPRTWSTALPKKGTFKIRVPNPMKGGKPLRFANRNQSEEWLTIKP